MDFIDLKTPYQLHKNAFNERIQKVLDHGKFIMGPEVFELEEKLAKYVGVKHCISCSSGTDALLISLMAIGIEPGDEVITTSFSFIATAEVITLLRAKPVFVDIEPDTYNIDATLIENAITEKTKAIMPVSLYGQCSDMATINDIAARNGNIPVIEDGAQSFGATYHGQRSGGLSTIGCTSFFPSKPLGCFGDGGACFTNDDKLAERMRQIRMHGQSKRYHHTLTGINGRLDTIQAAVLLQKIELFPTEHQLRNEKAQNYLKSLEHSEFILPTIRNDASSIFAQFTLAIKDRGKVIEKLRQQNIPTAIHYPTPLHKQPYLSNQIELKHTEISARIVFSIPFSPYMKQQDQAAICNTLLNSL